MPAETIGVIGCGGAVGRYAVEDLLRKGYAVLGGQRNDPSGLLKQPAFQAMTVDVYHPASLCAFCAECDAVLNCAGPSFQIGSRVALVAMANGKPCVDVFGVTLLDDDKIIESNLRVPCVIGAGNVPGVSGLLAGAFVPEYLDVVHVLREYACGVETVTRASAMDAFLSALSGFGYAGQYFREGKLLREPPETVEFQKFLGLEANSEYVQPFLYRELIQAASHFGIREIHSYTVLENAVLSGQISRLVARYQLHPAPDVLEQCVSELTSFQELALFGKNPHFILAVEADGEKDGCSRTIRQMVRMSGSYQTTAHMAVMTMERLLRNTPPPGVYWAFELLESSIVFREFSRLGCAVCAPWQEWHPEEGEIV